jgi:hypothetical protein
MADRRRGSTFSSTCRIALLCCPMLLGCDTEGQPMLLDQVCSQPSYDGGPGPACVVSGDAEITSGITPDATAVRLGTNGGVLRIRTNALQGLNGATFSLDVLAAANPLRAEGNVLFRTLTWGSCGTQCPPEPSDSEASLSEDYAWAEMVKDLASAQGVAPDDAVIELRGADIDILDLRLPGLDPDSYYY